MSHDQKEDISSKKLETFLMNSLDALRKGTLSRPQRLLLVESFLQSRLMESSQNVLNDDNMFKYMVLGWYCYQFLLKDDNVIAEKIPEGLLVHGEG